MNTLKNIQSQIKQNTKFTKFFKRTDAQSEILYWKNKYNDLALKILCLEVEEPVETISADEEETPVGYVRESELTKIAKQGNPYKVRPWRTERDQKIKEMLESAVKSQVPFTRDLFKGIAQRVGSTSPKVKQVANQYFPNNDISGAVKNFFKI